MWAFTGPTGPTGRVGPTGPANGPAGVTGPTGPTGSGFEGPILAADVTYTNSGYPDLATVQNALDTLLYTNPEITNFSDNIGTVEIGRTITSITFNWSFNKTMVSASINNGVGAVNPPLTSKTITGTWTTNTSWTLTASDGTNSVNAGTSIAFDNQRYWGVSALETLTTQQILNLGNSEFATNFEKSVAYNCSGGGLYPYYVYPSAWGVPNNVTVGGLSFSAFTVTEQSFTNASGYTSAYNVIRFNGVQSGANIEVVWQ